MSSDASERRKRALRAPIADRLSEKPPRRLPVERTKAFVEATAPVTLERAEEQAVAAVGAMMLRLLAEHGQSKLFTRSIHSVVEATTRNLTAAEVMRLEVEAYEAVDWLVGDAQGGDDDDTPRAAIRDGSRVLYNPQAPIADLVRHCIAQGIDMKIDYFSRQRGQMNTRRVTPIALDAETYMRAWCHARRAERVFQVRRITRCVPLGGAPSGPITAVEARAFAPASADAPASAPEVVQTSLLDD